MFFYLTLLEMVFLVLIKHSSEIVNFIFILFDFLSK